MSCAAIRQRSQKPCPRPSLPDSQYCEQHDPRPEWVEKRKQLAAENGRLGNGIKRQRREEETPQSVPLSTVSQIREYIEQLAALVEHSAGDACSRARAGADLAKLALSLIEKDIERQARELEALLQAHPELRRRLVAIGDGK